MTIKLFALAGVALGALATPVAAAPPPEAASVTPATPSPGPVRVLAKRIYIP